MSNDNPIGIFDSGIGGLSVWREIAALMPNESTVYFADNANCPYGSRSEDEITDFCEKITDFFIERKCKIIVVACNTATSMVIWRLRRKYSELPFVGIEPALKPAVLRSKTGRIGVLATSGTLKSRLFNKTKERFAGSVEITATEGNGLVELIENGKQDALETEILLRKYIEPMSDNGIDCLVLGCTHYPFLSDVLKKITGSGITLFDPAAAVAAHVSNTLKKQDSESDPDNVPFYEFYSSGDPGVMISMVDKINSEMFFDSNIKINSVEFFGDKKLS